MSHGNNLQLDIIAEYFSARRGRRDVLVVEESAQIPFRPNGLLICQRQGRLMVCTGPVEVPFGPLAGTKTLTFTALKLGPAISAIAKAGLRRQGKVSITSINNLKGALEVTLDIADDVFDAVLAILRGIPGVTFPPACVITGLSPSVIPPGPRARTVDITYLGSGLSAVTSLRLEGRVTATATSIRIVSDSEVVGTFSGRSLPVGVYDAVAVTPDEECRLEDALDIQASED